MRNHVALCFFCLSVVGFRVQAQKRLDTLSTVEVQSNAPSKVADLRSRMQIGQFVQEFDSSTLEHYQTENLASLLGQQSPVFIKSYGINGLATLSFRGASAAQSAVFWEGVPVINPAVGVADLSLLQTGLFDQIHVQYGSNAALMGSGNVGGALLVGNRKAYFTDSMRFGNRFGLAVGSYGRWEAGWRAKFSNKHLEISTHSFFKTAKNDFPFADALGSYQRTQNAELRAWGNLSRLSFRINPYQQISAQLWVQKYSRALPRALFEPVSTKQQIDQSLRSVLSWTHSKGRQTWQAKSSYNVEKLNFSDSLLLMDNHSRVGQYFQDVSWKRNGMLSKALFHQWLISTPVQYSHFIGKQNSANQWKAAVVAAYQLSHAQGLWQAQASLRQEWVDGSAVPFLPGLGVLATLLQKKNLSFQLRSSLQKTYRVPTLNELHNFPGGNSKLKPEEGWSWELGYDAVAKSEKQDLEIQHRISYFNRRINDWIYWLGGAIWTPHNLAQVHSRGVETDNTISWKLNKEVGIQLQLKTAYVLSTTTRSDLPNDGSIGKQIPYAPRYSGMLNWRLDLAHFQINYNHSYTGYRFITTDESQYLEPYDLANLQAMFRFEWKKTKGAVYLQLQNLWNKHYVVVAQRPMPGRAFLTGLQFEI